MYGHPTILVVEDDALVCDLVVEILEGAGFDVLTACDGDAALNLMSAASQFDVLLTDIRMPGSTDGWTLAEKARAWRPDLPVIYVSGYSPQNSPVDGSIFLAKPYRSVTLLNALDQLGIQAAC
jgi:CheY-like chemotaxis protein